MLTRAEIQLAVSTYITVFLLALQSQLVIYNHPVMVFFTSLCIGASQFFMIRGAAQSRWHGAVCSAFGGAFGVLTAMGLFRGFIM